jgi:hypothetical protein
MRQRIIAVASTVTGLAVMALVFSLQRDRSMWTHAAAAPESAPKATASPAARAATRPPPAPSVGIVTLPPVVITGSSPARAEKKLDVDTLAPCSEWRELGPTYVEEGKAHGTRRVRSLC